MVGGTGGASFSIPFFREAPAGRLIVSIEDVVERKTGSEISDFAIDFFRSTPVLVNGCTVLGLKAVVLGVVGFETGGVWLAENGGTGEVGCEKALALPLLKPPGDGRGEIGIPGENLPCGGGRREFWLDPVLVWMG